MKKERTEVIGFRLPLKLKEQLSALAKYENKTLTEYLNLIIEELIEQRKTFLLIKEATVKALISLNIPDKIISVIDKPEDVKGVMGEDKYNEFYEIYKKYKLEAK